jgi:tRNA modification GTPase
MPIFDDTIAAIATAPGTAGLAVVRVSGREAFAVAGRVFRGSAALADAPTHTLHHGWVVWPGAADGAGERMDEIVAAVFRAPKSYTREHVIEFSCHGGRLPAARVLEALLAAGARLANPGEFTLRAFLNGRIDLAQAEAVADLIHAETESARELALHQLAGALSRRIDALADRLADAVAEVEARIDFAEDVGGVKVPPHVVAAIAAVDEDLARLLESAAWGRAVRGGVRMPIVGRPNVGKSSLFNALVGEERAIVTAAPGTTRDRVSEAIEIAGIRVTLSDTAGLRESDEPIEAIGVARARETLAEAAFALWVVDGAAALAEEDLVIAGSLRGKRVLVALNKRDAGAVTLAAEVRTLFEEPPEVIELSVATGAGLDALRAALARMLGVDVDPDRADGRAVIDAAPVAADGGSVSAVAARARTSAAHGLAQALGNRRHVEALERARAALARAAAAAENGLPGELVALELREGLGAIGEVTGREAGEDLLERIFSRFCIGK